MDTLISQLQLTYAGKSISVDDTVLSTYLHNITSLNRFSSLDALRVSLADSSPCILPCLSPKPAAAPWSKTFELEVKRSEINDFCRYRNHEALAVFQLAWALMLRVFVGADKVCFGYELSGRDQESLPGLNTAVGSFATIVPCHLDLSPARTIRQCLQSLKELAAQAPDRQYLTMSEINHAMGLRNDSLFNTCLLLQDMELTPGHAPEKSASSPAFSLVSSSENADYDLSLRIASRGSRIHVDVHSRAFSAIQVRNTIGTFERALTIVLSGAFDSPISEVDLFTDRDYAHIAVQNWESGQIEEKKEMCLHQAILRNARGRPDAMAICSRDGNMTYGELSAFVSSLAAYLVNLGVRPGIAVPAVLDKSRWSPVIMLAILKAGGGVISLDAQETASVESALEQLQPQLVLATSTARASFHTTAASLIIVDDVFFSSLPPQVSIPARAPTPDHGACVLFSPGKTKHGTQKSIFFTHASLCSAFHAQGPAFKIGQHSRVLQLSAFNLDIALVEILGTMFHGGCVCIPLQRERGAGLEQAIARMNVTWSYMTAILARRIDPDLVPSLRTLCFRTRRLDEDICNRWMRNRDVLLAYGAPDVCPLGISVAEVTGPRKSTTIPPPLMGKYWILNPENPKWPMPVGAIGELAIDCSVVTPHTFVPGEFAVARRSRLYPSDRPRPDSLRTGHRVRYLDNGTIEFLSSMRDEIIMGGAAVPVMDIEQQLCRGLGRDNDVVVDSVTTSDALQVLAAFIEVGGQCSESTDQFGLLNVSTEMRGPLAKKLIKIVRNLESSTTPQIPAHHIPSLFIPISHFPLTTSLKINKRKLEKLVATMSFPRLAQTSLLPRQEDRTPDKPLPLTPLTHEEQEMRRVWASVLGIMPVDITSKDSFNGLGGGRFMAAALAVACRKASTSVLLRDLLRGATLSEVCQARTALDGPPEEAGGSRYPPKDSSAPVKVSGFPSEFITEVIAPQLKVSRGDVADMTEASSHQLRSLEMDMYSQRGSTRCLVLNFNGPVRHQRLELACDTLASLHPVLRTAFAVHEQHVYQVLVGSFRPAFKRVPSDFRRLESDTDVVIQQDQNSTVRLGEPATKFTFVDAGQQGSLVVRLSSAQIDEASVSTLVLDLTALYKNLNSVQPKSNFFDYVRAVRIANYHEGIDFWKQQLQGAKVTEIVSPSKPLPPVSDIHMLRQSIKLGYLGGHGLTSDTILKTAWGYVLSTLSGSNDVVFGEMIQGTGISVPKSFDVSSIVGPVTNTIPVRIHFASSPSAPIELMRDVQVQRGANRPFESVGTLDLIRQCTDWAPWTSFSTVVQDRTQSMFDGSATLNMGSTTFTYRFLEPEAKDIPDLFVRSTWESHERAHLEIQYSGARIPTELAEEALRLLASSLKQLTRVEAINRPMLQPIVENAPAEARIPLPAASRGSEKTPAWVWQWLSDEQRVSVQSIISSAWRGSVKPPIDHTHETRFYDIWGSLVPAYFIAEYLNRELAKESGIPGLAAVKVTPEEMINHPAMEAQYALLVTKMRDAGLISAPVRRRTTVLRPSPPAQPSPWAAPVSSSTSVSLRGSIRRLERSASTVREKAGGWMRSRSSRRDSRGSIATASIQVERRVSMESDVARAAALPAMTARQHLRTVSEPIAELAELAGGTETEEAALPAVQEQEQHRVSPATSTGGDGGDVGTVVIALPVEEEVSPVDGSQQETSQGVKTLQAGVQREGLLRADSTTLNEYIK